MVDMPEYTKMTLKDARKLARLHEELTLLLKIRDVYLSTSNTYSLYHYASQLISEEITRLRMKYDVQ